MLKNGITRFRALLVVIMLIMLGLVVLSVSFHIDLIQLENELFEFASHHLFITIFAAMLVFLICLRFYLHTPHKINSLNPLKKQTRQNRILYREQLAKNNAYEGAPKVEYVKSTLIEKEEIARLAFPQEDVLSSKEEINMREIAINRAMTLGNAYKQKVIMFFRDNESDKHVETTIWQVDKKYISLKSGLTLPVHRIYKLRF